jgi:hypothetical protein
MRRARGAANRFDGQKATPSREMAQCPDSIALDRDNDVQGTPGFDGDRGGRAQRHISDILAAVAAVAADHDVIRANMHHRLVAIPEVLEIEATRGYAGELDIDRDQRGDRGRHDLEGQLLESRLNRATEIGGGWQCRGDGRQFDADHAIPITRSPNLTSSMAACTVPGEAKLTHYLPRPLIDAGLQHGSAAASVAAEARPYFSVAM